MYGREEAPALFRDCDVDALKVSCPAKINLHLRVLRRRSDGYHDLVTLMQCVSLYDEVDLKIGGPRRLRIWCNVPELAVGQDNLVWKAASLYQEETGDRFGLEIRLTKRIPIGAGLGGGSSDAAGVLAGLNALRGGAVPADTLRRWAARLGADVPFFLLRRPAVATGIGDRLRRVEIIPAMNYLIVFPGWSVSTRWVYEHFDLGLTTGGKPYIIPTLIERMEDVVGMLRNDLESVTVRRYPWVEQAKARLLEEGAQGVLMSGSGPAVFGIFADEKSAEGAGQRLRSQWDADTWSVEGIV
jgi:4-diphosphocytidyl-2-C-methyl-D-erythritol kinase